MNNLVVIKSNRYGLLVHLDPKAPYGELLTAVEEKFLSAVKFFKEARMGITFEGRTLTQKQELEIIGLIEKITGIHIVCIVDKNEKSEQIYERLVSKITEEKSTDTEGLFYRGTLQRRQALEADTNVIVLGDIESGASVIAKGSIIVIGSIYGNVHAGASGNASAVIVSLNMRPEKLFIADISARKKLKALGEKTENQPMIACLEQKNICINLLVR